MNTILKNVSTFTKYIIQLPRLPSIIGTEAMQTFGLQLLTEGFSNDYRNDIDPRITNEFATAGLRMGHSFIPSFIRLQNAIGDKLPHMDWRDIFFQAGNILPKPDMINSLTWGMLDQSSNSGVDQNFANDVSF